MGARMTLETIYYIGQTVAVIVIIATLVALLIQTRQTNKLAKIETSRTTGLTLIAEQQRLFGTPEDAAFMNKAMFSSERLSEDEKVRFGFSMALLFGLIETAQLTHQSGLFRDTYYYRAKDTLRLVYLRSPRVRKWWASSSVNYASNPEFVNLVDSLAANAKAADESDKDVQSRSNTEPES